MTQRCDGHKRWPVWLLSAFWLPPFAVFAAPLTIETQTGDTTCHGIDDGWARAIVSGGTPPFAYEWIPAGGNAEIAVDLAAGGYIVSVRDADGDTAQATASVNEPPPVWIDIAPLPEAQAYTPYAAQILGGGVGTLTYALSAGQLPPGVHLAIDGALSGMPTQVGAYTFAITATDTQTCAASQTYTLQVRAHEDIVFRDGFDAAP